MIDMQDQNFSPDGSPRSEQDPGLRVQVRLAEPIKDLRTRDEKLTQFPEKIDYLAKNLVFELRFTLKDLTDAQRTQLGISAEDMKFLNEAVPNSSDFSEILKSTKLTKEQLERINEIDRPTGRFLTSTRPTDRAFAREGLALPSENKALFYQEVRVPAGIRLQRSRALPAFGKRGGLEQFELLE